MSKQTKQPQIYIRNKDLLAEIHKSKLSYCYYEDDDFAQQDIIVKSYEELEHEDVIKNGKINRAKRLTERGKQELKDQGKHSQAKSYVVSPDTIADHEVVIRIMTSKHIPLDPHRKRRGTGENAAHKRTNFLPFIHVKFIDGKYVEGLRSHWKGGFDEGEFDMEHGQLTDNLCKMFQLLITRYSRRPNWRNYCVDTETEALTDAGWVSIDTIDESQKILSYSNGDLVWSKIKSIYRGDHNGLMHKLTCQGLDALITPEHKMMTERGLIKAEYLLQSDKIILMGNQLNDNTNSSYSDALVELLGWITTEGCYNKYKNGKIKSISVHQNEGEKADRIRNCLETLDYKFTESKKEDSKLIKFYIFAEYSRKIVELMPEKRITHNFINELTPNQRTLLMETMIDGDGWRSGENKEYRRYSQKCFDHISIFQYLCTLNGYRSVLKTRDIVSFGKNTKHYTLNIYSKGRNGSRVENINFHGGLKTNDGFIGKTKDHYLNEPTTHYEGRVWCPQTEYGCFIARRNGNVYLTGNTYLDEMQALSLFQLIQEGLRFNEAVGDNPFSFYTSVLTNCFTKVFNIEKNNQMIRDDLLIMAGVSPSFTRQVDQEYERDHVTSPSDVTIVFKADDDSEMDFDESNVEQVIDFEDEEYEVEEEIEEVIEKPKKKEKKIDRRRKENKNNNNEFLVFK